MKEYRTRTNIDTQVPSAHASTWTAPQLQSHGWDQLAQQYGLDDMIELNDNSVQPQQTVDEEFLAYTTALLSARDTNIIKFWEVSYLLQ